MIFGRETAPDTGTPHLQGYVYFENARTFGAMKELLPTAHLEKAREGPRCNYEYCSKGGDFEEFGVRPLEEGEASRKGGEAVKRKWEDAKKAAQEGDLDRIPGEIFVRYYKSLKTIHTDYQEMPKEVEGVVGRWFYGPTGTGKSRAARDEYPDAYLKNAANKWWCGYKGERYVIIDDLDKAHKEMGYYLKIWLDRYPFQAETKGGSMIIRPEVVVITSNYRMEDIWEDETTLLPLRRRCRVTRFESMFNIMELTEEVRQRD